MSFDHLLITYLLTGEPTGHQYVDYRLGGQLMAIELTVLDEGVDEMRRALRNKDRLSVFQLSSTVLSYSTR